MRASIVAGLPHPDDYSFIGREIGLPEIGVRTIGKFPGRHNRGADK
jgi:hypothetical protein